MLEYFTRLLAYNRWANHSVVIMLQEQSITDEKIYTLFSHLLSAEQVWYRRIIGQSMEGIDLWGTRSLDVLAQEVETNYQVWETLLDGSVDFNREVHYTNTRGDDFSTPMWEIMVHVMNHGTHHRGQLLSRLRAINASVRPLDFIAFVRQSPLTSTP